MFAHEPSDRLLSAYHDGELPPSTAFEVQQHLEQCDACRGEYRRLAKVANAVRHFPHLDAPVSLARAIRQRVDEELRGMVPILRDELLSCRRRPNLLPAVSLGAFLILGLLGGLISFDLSRGPARSQLLSRWDPGPLPVPLQVEMSTPRFRDGSVNLLPFTEVERGKAGTVLTLASIDQNGAIQDLRVIHSSGDEKMLSRTLEVVRASGFEPARLGQQAVAVHFLYLFTTTEVRSKRII
jgi:TonB family protein